MSGLEITRADWDASAALDTVDALGRTALERADAPNTAATRPQARSWSSALPIEALPNATIPAPAAASAPAIRSAEPARSSTGRARR